MSATTADYPERLNLAEQVARIERSNAETQKFVAEQRKLMAESEKLAAEERKLGRERRLAPWVGMGAYVSGAVTVAGLVAHAYGWIR